MFTTVGGLLMLTAAMGAAPIDDFVGTWRGMSKCLVKPSSCNDEDSVYRISAVLSASDRVLLSANKIVDGREINMGTSECAVAQKAHALHCPLPNGASMELTALKRDVVEGHFQLADGTLWRTISLTRTH